MRIFACPNCRHTVFFENRACLGCGFVLGYSPADMSMLARAPEGGAWLGGGENRPGDLCINAGHGVCNWLAEAGPVRSYCLACRHNRTIPDLSVPANLRLWGRIEEAKRYLFYGLLRLGLTPGQDLGFEFLADSAAPAMTGHRSGLVTIALAEADDAERERRRAALGEPYRTLLGHFRHEVGHYFWDRLIAGRPALAPFRALFGSETLDYGRALEAHYASGPPPDWPERHVSAYASAHPWEDFAETWAHYLHIVDTLETTKSAGLSLSGSAALTSIEPYGAASMDELAAAWIPVSVAINAVNRSMGLSDLYPFVLTPLTLEKLAFVHAVVRSTW